MAEKTLNESDLIRVFMEKHAIQRGHGGTPLPAPLGTFPFCCNLIKAVEREGFSVRKSDRSNSFAVSDEVGIMVRKFRSRTVPEIWVWPSPAVDHHLRSVVCPLTIRTGDSVTFSTSTNERLCRAITATHPECHPIIKAAGAAKPTTELWSALGFGPISTLSEFFEKFRRGREILRVLNEAGIGLFKPYPTSSIFVHQNEERAIVKGWQVQLKEFKKKL